MLGLRLDETLERRLARYASDAHRTKSEIARDAVREYLDRHSMDDEIRHELGRIAAAGCRDSMADVDALGAEALAGLPTYDWSDRQP